MKTNIKNFYNYLIALTLASILASVLLSTDLTYVLAFLGIFSFGILHGSNDLFVIEQMGKKNKQNQFYKSLFTYLGVVLSFVVIFYSVPFLALLAFVIISGYHFGEQHFHQKVKQNTSVLASLFFLSYGLLILFLLFYLNLEEVILIIEDMTGIQLMDELFIYALLLFLVSSLALYIPLSNVNASLKKSAVINVFYLILFAAVFYVGDVVWSFATYFVLWHSIPSLKDQINSLYGVFHFNNFLKYFKKAFPYWLASILGMFVVVYLFKDSKNFLSLLFAFIAAITFPHVFVMRKLFNKN